MKQNSDMAVTDTNRKWYISCQCCWWLWMAYKSYSTVLRIYTRNSSKVR